MNSRYYLLLLHMAFFFPGASVPIFYLFGTFVIFHADCARQREKVGSVKNQINHPACQLHLFPAGSFISQLPSICLWFFGCPFFLILKLCSTYFCQVLGNIFPNCARNNWCLLGTSIQGALVLLLVGALSGKIIKIIIMWISNYWVIHLKEILIS